MRHIRFPPDSEDEHLLLLETGQSGISSRRVPHEGLDFVSVRVSANSAAVKSPQGAGVEEDTMSSDCSILAIQKMVSPPTEDETIAALPLPPSQDCLVHMVYSQVEACVDPLYAFLLDGSLCGEV